MEVQRMDGWILKEKHTKLKSPGFTLWQLQLVWLQKASEMWEKSGGAEWKRKVVSPRFLLEFGAACQIPHGREVTRA